MKIGIDLGGTKIEALVLTEGGEEVFRKRLPTPQGDYTATLEAIETLVLAAEGELGVKLPNVGMGIPGSLDPDTHLVQNSNSVCLIGHPLQSDIEKLSGRHFRIRNDANCFTLSEAIDGAATGYEFVFGVIIGTGVGGGFVFNERIITGANSISGEWGHIPLPWPSENELPGPLCYCGKNGCNETFLSGPGLQLSFESLTGKKEKTEKIMEMVLSKNESAIETLRLYEQRLAKALAVIINSIDPNVIVLGGGLSNIDSLYENVPKLWKKHVFSDSCRTKLLKPKYGDSSGARGAAWLF